MKIRLILTFVMTFSLLFSVTPQTENRVISFDLEWTSPISSNLPDSSIIQRLYFKDAVFEEDDDSPVFRRKIRLDQPATSVDATIDNARFSVLTSAEIMLLDNLTSLQTEIIPNAKVARARNKNFAIVSFEPFRLNPETGKYEKLISFDLIISTSDNYKSVQSGRNYADNSVLATGNWYKVRIAKTGLYKVTYTEMAEMGMNVSGLNSANIRLYGNGGGMLPEANDEQRYDDLQERAIEVFDGGDGQFNEGDYFVFYGTGPDIWEFQPMDFSFEHQKNIYDDYAYYYITTDLGPGKRVGLLTPGSETPNHVSTTFSDYAFHELDETNLIKSGREWYGEVFDLVTEHEFSFTFPNLTNGADHFFRTNVLAKSTLSSSFLANVADSTFTIVIQGTPDNPEGKYASAVDSEYRFSTSGETIDVSLKYNKSTSTAKGWLDYIALNVTRDLRFTGGQMAFRDIYSKGSSKITEFNLSNAGSGVTIWEVTDPLNVRKVNASLSGNTLKYTLPTPNVREFIAFDGNGFLTAEFVESVPNQDIHGETGIDYVIVSHPDFLDQAFRLAEFHSEYSNLNTLVVTPAQVYNEFSSGAQDITAIKDMMRMFYERAESGSEPKYLLLFGDASYDFKTRIENNSNFVPTFQSENSLHYIFSYATDDYYGYLDPEEGISSSDLLDIGIGRLVVQTPEEAEMAVDKIIHYATSPACLGDWQNMITFVADDENGNTHLNQAEELTTLIDTTYGQYNIDKIYIDSYIQESTPGGQRFPTVNQAINARIDQGTLIMNYTGHGGEVGWAHERILELSDINSWTNYDKMSVFVTATCEFARYDDPGRISAGEYVFLNPDGGGVALFTTARATYGGSNLSLNRELYKYAFEKQQDGYRTMGDLIMLSKEGSSSSTNDKKFVLLGDPALKISYPDYRVETIEINQQDISENADTLKALSEVDIAGEIVDASGNRIKDFDGTLYVSVFDKKTEVTTLGQDNSSAPRTFKLRKNVIYKGKTQVNNGEFSFSFIVPKDISYRFGHGKISYYAENGLKDANGFYENIIIGGYNYNATADRSGPDIELFMNDTIFNAGDITSPNPVLVARVYDESGINTVGNGIGHNIVAVLNGDTENPHNLNDFYESDFGGYQNGTVEYPFHNLPPGKHEVMFRVWDVFNNSSEAYLAFEVIGENEIVIDKLINYPNPFVEQTWFSFNHNRAESELDVEIEIFDFSGRLMTVLEDNNVSGGFYNSPISWDGTNAGGQRLKNGFYIYRVTVTDEEGRSNSAVNKLVITR